MVYISIISDIALEEYLIKRDKNQFINTLKYFIESQDSKIDLLIIHIMEDGNFKFYDQNRIEIKDNNTEKNDKYDYQRGFKLRRFFNKHFDKLMS